MYKCTLSFHAFNIFFIFFLCSGRLGHLFFFVQWDTCCLFYYRTCILGLHGYNSINSSNPMTIYGLRIWSPSSCLHFITTYLNFKIQHNLTLLVKKKIYTFFPNARVTQLPITFYHILTCHNVMWSKHHAEQVWVANLLTSWLITKKKLLWMFGRCISL